MKAPAVEPLGGTPPWGLSAGKLELVKTGREPVSVPLECWGTTGSTDSAGWLLSRGKCRGPGQGREEQEAWARAVSVGPSGDSWAELALPENSLAESPWAARWQGETGQLELEQPGWLGQLAFGRRETAAEAVDWLPGDLEASVLSVPGPSVPGLSVPGLLGWVRSGTETAGRKRSERGLSPALRRESSSSSDPVARLGSVWERCGRPAGIHPRAWECSRVHFPEANCSLGRTVVPCSSVLSDPDEFGPASLALDSTVPWLALRSPNSIRVGSSHRDTWTCSSARSLDCIDPTLCHICVPPLERVPDYTSRHDSPGLTPERTPTAFPPPSNSRPRPIYCHLELWCWMIRTTRA